MFKYTAPWQVLLYSLDPYKDLSLRRLSTQQRHYEDLIRLRQSLTSGPAHALRSPAHMDISAAHMYSSPRRWVLRPLSPSLQPSDLRSISAQHDHSAPYSTSLVSGQAVHVDGLTDSSADVVVVAARQVSVSQDDGSSSEDLPVSRCSSSADSHSGFYSFVDDPFSPEAEQNEAWMVSPQRQSHLAVLRHDESFKLQTYSNHAKPGSLFQDGDTDAQYQITPKFGYQVVGEEEERRLREEIIRGQAHKKNPVVEKVFDDNTSRLIDGFSISYSNVGTKPKSTVDSEAIIEEQINFDAARKQFVQMERNKVDPIIRPRKIQVKTSPKPRPEALGLDKEVKREELEVKQSREEEKEEQRSGHSRQSSSLDDSDVFFRFSSVDVLENIQTQSEISVEPETPIEREIRIAQEREENLRQTRGLQHSAGRREMVQIETKRLNSPLPLTPTKSKEKNRVGFIFQEIQRKGGTTRHDGSTQHLGNARRERAGSFDVLQAATDVVETKELEKDEAKLDVVDYALQKQNYYIQDGSKVEYRQSLTGQAREYVEPYVRQEKYADQARNGDYKSLEGRWQKENGHGMETGEKSLSDKSCDEVSALSCGSDDQRLDRDQDQAPAWRDSLQTQVQGKFVEQDIEEALRRERELKEPRLEQDQAPAWRDSLQTRGQAQFVEQDIEEALRRERELKEERAKQVYSPQTLVEQADKMAATQFYPPIKTGSVGSRSTSRPVRLSTVPLMSPQPWSPAPQTVMSPQTLQIQSQFYQTLQTRSQSPQTLQTRSQSPQTLQTQSQSYQTWSQSYQTRSQSPQSPQTMQTQSQSYKTLSQSYLTRAQSPQTLQTESQSYQTWSQSPQTLQTESQSYQTWSQSPQTLQTQSQSYQTLQTRSQSPPVVRPSPLPVRGLTQTLLQDFEERRVKLKLEESKYAGIQPVDSVNNEVVESTRVTRHKNQRALQWEAGLYLNQHEQ